MQIGKKPVRRFFNYRACNFNLPVQAPFDPMFKAKMSISENLVTNK